MRSVSPAIREGGRPIDAFAGVRHLASCFAARRERGAIRSQRASLRKLTRKVFGHKRLLGFHLGAAPPRRPFRPFPYSSYWMDARSAVMGVTYSSTAARWTGWSR